MNKLNSIQFLAWQLSKYILDLSPEKTFYRFGLILPLFPIWLRTIGLYFIRRNGNNPLLFNILSFILIILFIFTAIISVVISLSEIQLPDRANIIIPILIFFVWFTCNAIVSKNMIDYRERENEYFKGFKWTIKDYTFRFFHLFYFPFSIYSLQKEIRIGIEKE